MQICSAASNSRNQDETRYAQRRNVKRIMWLFLMLTGILVGCAIKAPYTVAVAEETALSHCTYIGTLAENSDMGAFQIHPKFNSDVREKVLQKAEMLGATHLAWLADYPFGASAVVYYCGK